MTAMLWWWGLYVAIGAVGTWLAGRYAVSRSLLDQPGERRSHQVATPRGGGIAVVAAVLVATVALAIRDPQHRDALLALAVGTALVAGIGMLDDHRPLSVRSRLLVHALAAAVLALAVGLTFSSLSLALLAFVAAMILTNVWNFMDGINGLAASQALLMGLVLAVGGGSWGLLALALSAACLGFLPFNFPRARIFLGDVGSGAIGFVIAGLVLLYGTGSNIRSLVWLLPLSAFLIDAGLTLFRRVLRKERWWTAHTQHAYQVWARRIGHMPVTLAYAAWTITAILLMGWLVGKPSTFMLCTGLAWYTTGALSWWILQRLEPRGSRGVDQPGRGEG